MQAPKRETADHVWRMAFEQCQSPSVIIMLTNDGGFPYYPKDQGESRAVNEHDEFEDRFHGVVTCEEFKVSDDGATEIRKLVMKVEGVEEEKSFYHLLYLRWPDYGIPKESEKQSLTNLIHLANSLNKSSENQRIVHCRAGVGRTGTFMALDFLLRELEEGAFAGQVDPSTGEPWKKGDDDVFSTVNTLRMQRALSVQTSIQYKLIYQMLREAFEKKYGVVVKSAGSEASGSRPSSKGLGFGGPTILHLDGADEDDPFM